MSSGQRRKQQDTPRPRLRDDHRFSQSNDRDRGSLNARNEFDVERGQSMRDNDRDVEPAGDNELWSELEVLEEEDKENELSEDQNTSKSSGGFSNFYSYLFDEGEEESSPNRGGKREGDEEEMEARDKGKTPFDELDNDRSLAERPNSPLRPDHEMMCMAMQQFADNEKGKAKRRRGGGEGVVSREGGVTNYSTPSDPVSPVSSIDIDEAAAAAAEELRPVSAAAAWRTAAAAAESVHLRALEAAGGSSYYTQPALQPLQPMQHLQPPMQHLQPPPQEVQRGQRIYAEDLHQRQQRQYAAMTQQYPTSSTNASSSMMMPMSSMSSKMPLFPVNAYYAAPHFAPPNPNYAPYYSFLPRHDGHPSFPVTQAPPTYEQTSMAPGTAAARMPVDNAFVPYWPSGRHFHPYGIPARPSDQHHSAAAAAAHAQTSKSAAAAHSMSATTAAAARKSQHAFGTHHAPFPPPHSQHGYLMQSPPLFPKIEPVDMSRGPFDFPYAPYWPPEETPSTRGSYPVQAPLPTVPVPLQAAPPTGPNTGEVPPTSQRSAFAPPTYEQTSMAAAASAAARMAVDNPYAPHWPPTRPPSPDETPPTTIPNPGEAPPPTASFHDQAPPTNQQSRPVKRPYPGQAPPPTASFHGQAPPTTDPHSVQAPPTVEQSKPVKIRRMRAKAPLPARKCAMGPEEPFASVTSNLGLKTGKNKVVVTLGEISRRMGAPEFQDWKMIKTLTRYARTATLKFERKLATFGYRYEVDPYAEKRPYLTIASLMEGDAVTLAADFNKIVSTDLYGHVLAAIVVEATGDTINSHTVAIKQLLVCVREYFLCVGREPKTVDSVDLGNPDAAAMRKFSLETHGFGPLAVLAVVDSLLKVFRHIEMLSVNSTADKIGSLSLDLKDDDLDDSLLSPQPGDDVVYQHPVLARIGYDIVPIEVTMGELRRRVVGPEELNATDVTAFVRISKISGSLRTLRENLTEYGMRLDDDKKDGRLRKTVHPTSWTSLSEKESMAMARETGHFLCRLPASHKLKEEASGNREAAGCLRTMVVAIGEAMERAGETPEKNHVETMADRHMLRFALISHHFGHNFYRTVMGWLRDAL